MDMMTVGELLKDLRSIKLTKDKRAFVDRCRTLFEDAGCLPNDQKFKLYGFAKRYSRQFKELHESRARARKTNGLRSMGITKAEAERRVQERIKQEKLRQSDVGF